MEAGKRTGSDRSDCTRPKKPLHVSNKLHEQKRAQTRINIGDAFEKWREVRTQKGLQTDAELAKH